MGEKMIRYALSAGAFENHITDGVAAAIRKSRFRNFEPYFGVFTSDDEPARLSAKLMRQLLREDVFHPARGPILRQVVLILRAGRRIDIGPVA